MTIRSIAGLAEAGLVPGDRSALEKVAARYAVALTPALVDLIDLADPADPIAAQFVPHPDELLIAPEERADPIGDEAHSPVPGIVHRYPDRVLLKIVHVCPVYCRFCFRREVVGPGEDALLDREGVDRALDYIAGTPTVWEVILTGGDPLILSPRRIAAVMERLSEIAHVRVVRFHTRVPVTAPERIGDELIDALKKARKALYVAVHANHAREFTAAAQAACARLVDSGIPLMSQTVLLRGINDHPATLETLMRTFVENRIRPYYLHHADLAPGTARFRTEIAEGQALVAALRGRVSGLCQPTYVLDLPGGFGKVILAEGAVVERMAEGRCILSDRHGERHLYPPSDASG